MSFTKITLSTLAITLSTIASAEPVIVKVQATAHQYSGLKDHQVYTMASHDIEIINNTDKPESFSYAYVYCAEFVRDCATAYNNITVQPHSKWNNHHDSYLSPIFYSDGNFQLSAMTQVTGKVNGKYTANGYVMVR